MIGAGRVLAIAALAGGGALLSASCLPGDERPEPGSILVSVKSTPNTRAPFETDDRWTVTIERFVAGVGDVRLNDADDVEGQEEPETCNDYAETRYERLYDFAVLDGTEKVGLVYGLGDCNVEVRLQPPGDDPVLGTGASEKDVEQMRLRGTDDYAEEERTSLYVVGSATKEEKTKRFAWAFRTSFEVRRCGTDVEPESDTLVSLEGGDEHALVFEVRAEELFRRAPADISRLSFDLIAKADDDGDADGDVTFAELAEIGAPLDEYQFDDEDIEPPENMADLIYEQLYLRVVRVAGGAVCEIEPRDRGPGGPGR